MYHGFIIQCTKFVKVNDIFGRDALVLFWGGMIWCCYGAEIFWCYFGERRSGVILGGVLCCYIGGMTLF